MKLRSIIIEGNKEDNKSKYPIRWYAHHITQLFMHFLSRKIEIDGMTQITIVCGLNNSGIDWKKGVYYDESFDYNKFLDMTEIEKNEYFVILIEKTLVDIAQKYGQDNMTIDEIKKSCRLIRENNYSAKIKIAKLSKTSSDKRYKVSVYRCLSYKEGEAWFVNIEDKKNKDIYTQWLTNIPGHLDKRDFFKKIILENNYLKFYDRLEKLVYTIQLSR